MISIMIHRTTTDGKVSYKVIARNSSRQVTDETKRPIYKKAEAMQEANRIAKNWELSGIKTRIIDWTHPIAGK